MDFKSALISLSDGHIEVMTTMAITKNSPSQSPLSYAIVHSSGLLVLNCACIKSIELVFCFSKAKDDFCIDKVNQNHISYAKKNNNKQIKTTCSRERFKSFAILTQSLSAIFLSESPFETRSSNSMRCSVVITRTEVHERLRKSCKTEPKFQLIKIKQLMLN